MHFVIEFCIFIFAAILFIGLAAVATELFQAVFYSKDVEDLKLFEPDEEDCLADETLQYPLQHPSNFTDFR